MSIRGAVSLLILLGFAASASGAEAVLEPRLAALEWLTTSEWSGRLASPDGSRSAATRCRFEPLFGGSAMRIVRATPELDGYEEGFVYWDGAAGRIAFFLLHSRGVFATGTVTVEPERVTFAGTMTWPSPPPDPAVRQSYEFRNTLEKVAPGAMVDRWFQNAFGSWRPGHVISFTAAPAEESPAPSEGAPS